MKTSVRATGMAWNSCEQGRKPSGTTSTPREFELLDKKFKRLGCIVTHSQARRKHAWRARIIPETKSGMSLADNNLRTGKPKPAARHWHSLRSPDSDGREISAVG